MCRLLPCRSGWRKATFVYPGNMLWEIYRKSNTLIWFLCFLLSCEKPAKESLKINKRKICTVGYIIFSAKSFLYSLRTFLLRSRLFKTRLSDFFRLVTQFINFTILCKFTFFYLLRTFIYFFCPYSFAALVIFFSWITCFVIVRLAICQYVFFSLNSPTLCWQQAN